NYTSTYYHAKETDYEYEPSERDLARYVQRDLSYAMRNPGGLGSFDGTYSDYMIYPKAGFSVLRVTEIPAILVECGFFTNPHEESRLVESQFNQIQAWGIFRGLARYFAAGTPVVKPIDEKSVYSPGSIKLKYSLIDPVGIDPTNFIVQFDSTDVPDIQFDKVKSELTINLTKLKTGEFELKIITANKNGIHNFSYKKKLKITN
ncbi:MAG: N-acetylmuramoyl-L-alanine amidase, partial [Ignavibacteriaceae bacterium]|nr:N-acetylmuramoyl-L-alanine amidase [Ignavibacteriaceae bacterium]